MGASSAGLPTRRLREIEMMNHRIINAAPDMLKALIEIAAFDDEQASERLAAWGSYGSFDEPGSVQIARECLSKFNLGPAR